MGRRGHLMGRYSPRPAGTTVGKKVRRKVSRDGGWVCFLLPQAMLCCLRLLQSPMCLPLKVIEFLDNYGFEGHRGLCSRNGTTLAFLRSFRVAQRPLGVREVGVQVSPRTPAPRRPGRADSCV